mmetsp:Transcript_757/g.1654  ORF Transcript_757/g.1654 Transcript_757/m.1654 type:complete len:546 (-) Transcript_757:9-1646(-)
MEVITLQVGHFANHVGAHFWNFQDESAAHEELEEDDSVDYSRLFQCVEVQGVATWRPRVLSIDRKGASGATAHGAVVTTNGDGARDDEEVAVQNLHTDSWDGQLELLRSEVVPKHPFQVDLEAEALEDGEQRGIKSSAEYSFGETVRTWSDYLKVQLPRRSVYELERVHHGISPFAFYFEGLEMRGQEEEEILDKARRQVELCDQLEALQVIYDMQDGMGGVSELLMRWAKEEMPKSGKFLMAVMPEETELAGGARPSSPSWCESMVADGVNTGALDYEASAWLSAGFSFARLLDCDPHAFVPVPVPLWSVRPDGLRPQNLYEASALPGLALDTALLPCRLRGGPRPSQFVSQLAPNHQPCCGLLQALPLPSAPAPVLGEAPGSNDTLEAHLQAGAFFDLSLMPASSMNPYTSVVLRSPEQRRLLNFTRTLPPAARRQSFLSKDLRLPVTFPQALVKPPSAEELEVASVCTTLHAAAGARKRCEALRRMADTLRQHQRSAWSAALKQRFGLETDELHEALELVTEQLESSADLSDEGTDDDVSEP